MLHENTHIKHFTLWLTGIQGHKCQIHHHSWQWPFMKKLKGTIQSTIMPKPIDLFDIDIRKNVNHINFTSNSRGHTLCYMIAQKHHIIITFSYFEVTDEQGLQNLMFTFVQSTWHRMKTHGSITVIRCGVISSREGFKHTLQKRIANKTTLVADSLQTVWNNPFSFSSTDMRTSPRVCDFQLSASGSDWRC